MSDVTKWVNDIREGIWTAFGKSGKDVMNVWTSMMVSNMRTGGNSYPSTLPIGRNSGDLADALQGKSLSVDEFSSPQDQIMYERRVLVSYADISERGGFVNQTPQSRKAMFAKLKKMNKYVREEANIGRGMKIKFDHKAFKFVENSINEFSAKELQEAVMPHVLNELNKIPNIEITIGNK